MASPGDDNHHWGLLELEDPRLTIGSRARSGKICAELEDQQDQFDWQQHRPNPQRREDDHLSECHWRRTHAQFPSPPQSNTFPQMNQSSVRTSVGPRTPPSPRPPTPRTPPYSPPPSPKPSGRSLGSFSLSALGKLGRPKRTTRQVNVPTVCKKTRCNSDNDDAEVTIPCPMCRDVSVKLEQYFDHLTRLHKVNNGEFIKRLYRWTKREMEVNLDQQSLFHPSDNRSERLTKEFARITKIQLSVSSNSSQPSYQTSHINSKSSSGRAVKDKNVPNENKKATKSSKDKERRVERTNNSVIATTSTAKVAPQKPPNPKLQELDLIVDKESESQNHTFHVPAPNNRMSKTKSEAICTKFSCTECPYRAVSSAEVYRHFLSAHTSETCIFDSDFTPRKLHLIPLVERIKNKAIRESIIKVTSGTVILKNGDMTEDNEECEASQSASRSSDEEDCPLISPGTVVWAKMTGYPWWPGVVMPEPVSTKFYQAWKKLYHVLFFDRGTQLQRGWVPANRVETLDEEEVGHGWSGPRPAKMPSKNSKHFADVESALVWVGRVRGMSDEQKKTFFLPYVG